MSRAAVPTRGGPYIIACRRYNAPAGRPQRSTSRGNYDHAQVTAARNGRTGAPGADADSGKVVSAMSMQDDVNRIAQVLRETAYSLGVRSSRELEASWRDLAKAAILTTLETVREHQPQAWSPPSTAVTLWRAMIDVMRAEIERALLDS